MKVFSLITISITCSLRFINKSENKFVQQLQKPNNTTSKKAISKQKNTANANLWIVQKIMGTWVAKGFDTPTIQIGKSAIYYFRTRSSADYRIFGDSIHNSLDKSVEPHPMYLITKKGMETLVLTSNTGFESIVCRAKN